MRLASAGSSGPGARGLSSTRRTVRPVSSSDSRTKKRPRRALVRQWTSRGSSPVRNSRRPWKSPLRLRLGVWLRPASASPARITVSGTGTSAG
jgi:hypothetical protein